MPEDQKETGPTPRMDLVDKIAEKIEATFFEETLQNRMSVLEKSYIFERFRLLFEEHRLNIFNRQFFGQIVTEGVGETKKDDGCGCSGDGCKTDNSDIYK